MCGRSALSKYREQSNVVEIQGTCVRVIWRPCVLIVIRAKNLRNNARWSSLSQRLPLDVPRNASQRLLASVVEDVALGVLCAI